MNRIEVLNIPNLNESVINLIHEIHKQIDMRFGLTKIMLGIDAGRITAKEVETLIINR